MPGFFLPVGQPVRVAGLDEKVDAFDGAGFPAMAETLEAGAIEPRYLSAVGGGIALTEAIAWPDPCKRDFERLPTGVRFWKRQNASCDL